MFAITVKGLLLIIELIIVFYFLKREALGAAGKALAVLAPITLLTSLVITVVVNSVTINGFTFYVLLQANYVLVGAAAAFLIALIIICLLGGFGSRKVGEGTEK